MKLLFTLFAFAPRGDAFARAPHNAATAITVKPQQKRPILRCVWRRNPDTGRLEARWSTRS